MPQELQDKIFLYLDFKTLKNTRAVQSYYVKKTTEFKDINVAAQNGNLDNMKWLLENGCPWGKFTFYTATKNGNLDNMKWLLENGCPWNASTFGNAAENGNLDNMKWLLENGCPRV